MMCFDAHHYHLCFDVCTNAGYVSLGHIAMSDLPTPQIVLYVQHSNDG